MGSQHGQNVGSNSLDPRGWAAVGFSDSLLNGFLMLPVRAGSNRSGRRWGTGNPVLSDDAGCCRTLRYRRSHRGEPALSWRRKCDRPVRLSMRQKMTQPGHYPSINRLIWADFWLLSCLVLFGVRACRGVVDEVV